jgi:hypothetical protein
MFFKFLGGSWHVKGFFFKFLKRLKKFFRFLVSVEIFLNFWKILGGNVHIFTE